MTKIVAFAGKKQSGKTSSAKFLLDSCPDKDIRIYSFASPLKQLCVDILGLDPRQCYGEDKYKNEKVDCYWEDKQLTAREVMQIVGTEWFRTMQHNVWADATIRKILKETPEVAIIDDCRFPNEVEAVKKANGTVVKLKRNIYHSTHASEIALDPNKYSEHNFDVVIPNHELTLEQTNQRIITFLQSKNIL